MNQSLLMIQYLMLCLTCSASLFCQSLSIDPFSRISITSERATCKRISKQQYNCLYENNVIIKLADDTTVTATSLALVFDKKAKVEGAKEKTTLQTATLDGNVLLKNKKYTARARSAVINVQTKTCTLKDDVQINQKKVDLKDIPLEVASSQATINLATQALTFEGSKDQPVQTTLILEGHPSLTSVKRKKKSL